MGEDIIKKPKKLMMAVTSPTVRGIVTLANDLGIHREDIVYLNREGAEFILVYYGGEELE